MEASHRHLNSVQKLPNHEEEPFYTKVNPNFTEKTKLKIKSILQEAQDNNIISREESEAMNPDGTGAEKFYLNF